jgi:hypothetical protein
MDRMDMQVNAERMSAFPLWSHPTSAGWIHMYAQVCCMTVTAWLPVGQQIPDGSRTLYVVNVIAFLTLVCVKTEKIF